MDFDKGHKTRYLLELNQDNWLTIADQMDQYGGGFVKGLGKLFYKADINNKKKLIIAFPEYFWEYWQRHAETNKTTTA
jgi:hypothetical protein